MTTDLAKKDRADYTRLTAIAKGNLQATAEWFSAVSQIMDRRLWRGEYETAAEYLERELSFSSTRTAYRKLADQKFLLAMAGEEEEEPLPTKSAQIKQLGRLPDDPKVRDQVWKSAVKKAKGKDPSVETVQKVVDEYLEPDERPLDGFRKPVEYKGMWPVFRQRAEVEGLLRALDGIKNKLVKGQIGEPGMDYLPLTQLTSQFENIKKTVRGHMAYVICPSCGGGGCGDCQNMGWVTAQQYETITQE